MAVKQLSLVTSSFVKKAINFHSGTGVGMGKKILQSSLKETDRLNFLGTTNPRRLFPLSN